MAKLKPGEKELVFYCRSCGKKTAVILTIEGWPELLLCEECKKSSEN